MFNNMVIMTKLAFRSVFSNWVRNKVIVLIIAVAFALIQMLLAISEGLGVQIETFALDNLLGHMKILQKDYKLDSNVKNNFYIDQATLNKIESINGIKLITKRIQIPIVIKSERSVRNVILVGIDPKTERESSFIGKSYDYNKFDTIFKDNQVLVGVDLLKKLETKVGYKIVASGQNTKGKIVEDPLFITDTYNSTMPKVEEMFIISDINTVAKIYDVGNNITEVSIILTNSSKYDEVFAKVAKIIPADTILYGWGDLMPFLQNWLSMAKMNLVIFFGIVFFAAAIPLANTLLMSVIERMYEFGIIQALGVQKIYIAFFIFIEAFFIICIGLSFGVILGLFLSFILQLTGINISNLAAGAASLGVGDYIYAKIDLASTLKITVVMLIVTMCSSIYPALKAMLYNSVQALSKRG